LRGDFITEAESTVFFHTAAKAEGVRCVVIAQLISAEQSEKLVHHIPHRFLIDNLFIHLGPECKNSRFQSVMIHHFVFIFAAGIAQIVAGRISPQL
jgi:hypothetical protein